MADSFKRSVYKYSFVKVAKRNHIPLSLYTHRVLDLGWDEQRASTEPPSNKEKMENKFFNKNLIIGEVQIKL